MRRHLVLAALAASALACSGKQTETPQNLDNDSGSGGDGGDSGGIMPDFGDPDISLDTYAISPINAVVKNDLAAGSRGKQEFKVTKNGSEDVTASSTFTVSDPAIGTFDKNFFTCADLPTGVLGKSAQVTALPGNAVANVTCIALRTTGDKRDFFFVEAYNKDPEPKKDILKFGTNIKQVDVAFVQDTTASMGPEINNLRDSLTTIIASLKTSIPSVGLAVARHDDFPVAPMGYDASSGGAADQPFVLLQEVTTSESAAKSAVATLSPYRGAQPPESQYEALYQTLTGDGLSWTVAKAGSIPKHTPKSGTSGGVDFRAGSLPVVIEITDASWFDSSVYVAKGITGAHGKTEVTTAFSTMKAKFVGIHAVIEKTPGAGLDTPCTDFATPSCDSARGYSQARDLATATGSVVDPTVFGGTCPAGKCCTGIGGAAIAPDTTGKCPLVYQAKTDGTGVADSVVKAIQAISVGSLFDVTAIPSNDPSNPLNPSDGKPVDATKFILSIRAMDEGDTVSGCPAHAAKDTDGDGVKDLFIGVNVGTPVCFEVNAKKNDWLLPTKDPQFFNAFIDVVGLPGSVKLDRRTVLFLVPPKDPIAR